LDLSKGKSPQIRGGTPARWPTAVQLIPVNANEQVTSMIRRAQAAANESGT